MNLEPYYATDRRVYYGAPCTDMQREFDNTDYLRKELRKLNGTCTYFPMEGKFMAFTLDKFKEITGRFHCCQQQALIEAIQVLTGKQNGK